jgi:N-hydroxyarylamine O-acetyltransferase
MYVKEYLDRIGFSAPWSVDLQTLKLLHLLHLHTVPFENLDIHSNRKIVLHENKLYEKIIGRRRGGICYELNGLFAGLLKTIGFDVIMIAANVHIGETDLTPDFDHMVLIVNIDDVRYLVDVGFGDSFLIPLSLEGCELKNQSDSTFEISAHDGFYTLSKNRYVDNRLSTQPLFRFDLTPRSLEDFADRCEFHQNSSESHFRRKTVCSRAHSDGRITVSGGELIVTRGPKREVTELNTPQEVNEALFNHFGIVL